MSNFRSLKILLVQIRSDVSLLPAERREFVTFSQLEDEQIVTLDVFRQPHFTDDLIDSYDALMIGGLSDDDSDKVNLPPTFDPFIDNLNALMQRAIDQRIPSLLSCGGFMLASELIGAEVVIDPAQAELGIYTITLTERAKKDILFRTYPTEFEAVSGHIKSTVNLPPHCIHLAYSSGCQIHGFKVATAPFYAFQFHPEITCEDLIDRVEAYKDKYFASEDAYQNFIKMSKNTDAANSIITRFVQLVAEGKI